LSIILEWDIKNGGDHTMYRYVRPIRPDELFHHGVKGQKWGLRRFQGADGSLTAEGRRRYRVDGGAHRFARAMFNTEFGQRLAVRRNHGFRQDKKAIKKEYKEAVQKANMAKAKLKAMKGDADKAQIKQVKMDRKSAIKEAKAERKASIGEAKVAAANAIYGNQSKSANRTIQTESTGKALAKSLLMGGYGAKKYNEMRHSDTGKAGRGKSYIYGLFSNASHHSIIDYSKSKTQKAPKQPKPKKEKKRG